MQLFLVFLDQWSPINPEGKKHYDREFLLQFQLAPEAVVKPPGLPEIPDIILDKVCLKVQINKKKECVR